ncbi:hypothetical protein ACQP2E_18140 [Actinoplanes sp. CA-015351]|uniref:hypothetical protein n=1 Tax=Actinoplanes sp. CA-015351 TaxID=3239897 RepID=UPI003D99372C
MDDAWVILELRRQMQHIEPALDPWPPYRIDAVITTSRLRMRRHRAWATAGYIALLIMAAAGGLCAGSALH